MEMDVNLVRCLRSTVGMSDIDRCYNEFVLNGLHPTSVIHHQQQQQQQQQHSSIALHQSLSNNRTINYSSYQNASSSSTSTSTQAQSNFLTATTTTTAQPSSYERRPPVTISGNLVRNNESVHIAQNVTNTNNNNNNNNNNENHAEIDRSNNVIFENHQIEYQFNNNNNHLNNDHHHDAELRTSSTSILSGITTPTTPVAKGCCITLGNRNKINKTPQEIYFESRGKSCKKLLKFNGYSNKILLYPEESWARSAASSYWTIKPSWWQPNRCKVTEITGSQRFSTKAKMLCIEKGSLLVMGSFKKKLGDSEFKLYLSSNITMEDYNMGYCLTGWVERRCSQTNSFQMTHFAVIKRQWPPPSITNSNAAAAAATNDSKSN